MRNFFRCFIALLAFLIGIGTVFVVESAIDRVSVHEVAAVIDPFDLEEGIVVTTISVPIDFQVKGVRIGASAKAVIKALGKPRRIERPDPNFSDLLIFHYDGLELSIGVYDGSKTVDSIKIVSAEQTFEGLTVGSTLDDVRVKLGPEHYSHEGFIGYNAISMDGYIAFSHDGFKVTAITTGFDGC